MSAMAGPPSGGSIPAPGSPGVCRKCYIHPAILDDYLNGSLLEALQRRMRAGHGNGPTAEEAAVMAFLRHRLEQDGNFPLAGSRRSSA